jgi:hypothetical protein
LATAPPTNALSPKARGWLRHIWRKATTPDDWSRDGEPHPWWDRYSVAPVLNFPRFDLSATSYTLLVMARRTPAWREVYVRILDELIGRHTTFWAAVDWLTQIGPDPDRLKYPEAYRTLIPQDLWGRYDVPGWTANGIAPWGLSPDPIGSQGNLFFRGYLNLMLAIHRDVSGADTWDRPFDVTGLGDRRFPWTHSAINTFLADQWAGVWHGPHCENTKVWPMCLSAAGLGLQLSDQTLGTANHWVFDRWTEDFLKQRCIGYDARGRLEWVGFYYDPTIDRVHGRSPIFGFLPAIYVLPQNRPLAEELYRKGVAAVGWDKNGAPAHAPTSPRGITVPYLLARELGDTTTERRLAKVLDQISEGKFFDGGDEGEPEEFGYFFRLGERYPRGQESALCMLADVMDPGEWHAAFNGVDHPRFDAPTLEGVDFPDLGIARAANDAARGIMTVETYAGRKAATGQATRFRVTRLPDADQVVVYRDGHAFDRWRAAGAAEIEIDSIVGSHVFEIRTGWRAAGTAPSSEAAAPKATTRRGPRRGQQTVTLLSATPQLVQVVTTLSAGAACCPCCA